MLEGLDNRAYGTVYSFKVMGTIASQLTLRALAQHCIHLFSMLSYFDVLSGEHGFQHGVLFRVVLLCI